MEKKDLYLDDFQMQTVFDLHKGDTDDFGMPFYKELSKASADYAVKKVIEDLTHWLTLLREADRNLMVVALNVETKYRARGKVSLINEIIKRLKKLIEG